MIKVDRLKFNIIFRFSLAFFLISIYILAVKDYSVVVILPCMVFLLGIYFSVKDIYNNIFLFSSGIRALPSTIGMDTRNADSSNALLNVLIILN